VSEATVSRVMNGKQGVSTRTQANVVRVLAELGYEPAALRTSPRAGSIGLIVPELDNPVFPVFAQAVEAGLLSSGYVSVLCCASRAGATEEDYVETLLRRGVAGMIIVSGRHADVGGDHGLYDDLVEREIPLVFINGHVGGSTVPSVSTDDRAAAIAAYEHLVALGHERIGLLTGPVCYVPVLRKIDGFRAAARAGGRADAEIDRSMAESMFTVEGGYAGSQRLLDEGITAIVAASDMMALGAIRAVRERGLDVPGDVSVVGYDDTDLMRFTDPPLTTVRQPVHKIADHATDVLLAQISGQPFEHREYLVEGELISRSSTARCATTVAKRT
jgi:alanine racemase